MWEDGGGAVVVYSEKLRKAGTELANSNSKGEI